MEKLSTECLEGLRDRINSILKERKSEENELDGLLLGDSPSWEERIILIKANSVEEVENKIDKYAKEYENSYINVYNQIVEIRLYESIKISFRRVLSGNGVLHRETGGA